MVINRAVVEVGQHPSAFLKAGAVLSASFKDNVKCMWLRLAVATTYDFIISIFEIEYLFPATKKNRKVFASIFFFSQNISVIE
jgi:hypothetical protein